MVSQVPESLESLTESDRGAEMATRKTKKKKAEKKKETNVMTNKEIVNLMTSEIGPSGKVLFVALAFSGGVDVHPYRAGDAYGLHLEFLLCSGCSHVGSKTNHDMAARCDFGR